MLALLMVILGLAVMFGARDFMGTTLRVVIGLVLILTFAPMLIGSCAALPGLSVDATGLGWLAIGGLVAFIGFILWRRRAIDARARELAARSAAPRERARPPAPRRLLTDDEELDG